MEYIHLQYLHLWLDFFPWSFVSFTRENHLIIFVKKPAPRCMPLATPALVLRGNGDLKKVNFWIHFSRTNWIWEKNSMNKKTQKNRWILSHFLYRTSGTSFFVLCVCVLSFNRVLSTDHPNKMVRPGDSEGCIG